MIINHTIILDTTINLEILKSAAANALDNQREAIGALIKTMRRLFQTLNPQTSPFIVALYKPLNHNKDKNS